MDDFEFREQEPELVRIAAEEEIRSSQPDHEQIVAGKAIAGDPRSGPRTRNAGKPTRRSFASLAGGSKNSTPKKKKVCLMRCVHEGAHFKKELVEEAITTGQLSIVMNPPIDSIIWSFCGFPEINNIICTSWVICTICKSVFSFSDGTTSGAKRHIESKHKQALTAVKEMGEVEPGQILVADYGATAIPMRLITESDIGDGIMMPRKRTKREPDSFEEGGSAETSMVDEHGVRVVFDDYHPETTAVRVRRPKINKISMQLTSTPFTSTHCNSCNVDFKNIALAMMHRSCHGTNGRFSCAQCGEVLGNVFDFWGHLYSRLCTH